MSSQRRSDGQQTHQAILDAAMRIASVEGFEGLSIGRLAREVGTSKSGVYAHFGSKAVLQIETIEAARLVFAAEVIEPAMAASPGLTRLNGLCESFLDYVEHSVFPGGCFFAGMLSEFDAKPGRMQQEVAADQREWLGLLATAAIQAQEMGELDDHADIDQLVFELQAALDLANFYFVLHRNPEFIERARVAKRKAIDSARPTSG